MPASTLRPLTAADWPAVFAAAMRAIPDAENDNREWLKYRQEIAAGPSRCNHCVVENDSGKVIGFGGIEEGPEPGDFRMFIVGAPEDTTGQMGERLFAYLSERLEAFDARKIWVREEARDPVLRFFESVGFKESARFDLPSGREGIVLEKDLQGLPEGGTIVRE